MTNNKTMVWKQASDVYADISELSPKQALAHLYNIKNITADVRDAVITLINAGSQASQYFADKISPNYNIGIQNFQNFQVGQQLDEYELLEELGHGGMSQVFKAKRVNSQQQTLVAVKIFAPRDNTTELLNHFINEQKILSGLSHPHIVKMLHGGMTDDKTAYLVMELIEQAQALDDYCQNNKLNTKMKMRFIAQCADALAYSHANLIIHRDLKPDNILVDGNNELKIVDFGIAKLISNDISGNKTTIMALTPNYAAPEQINSEQISVKTDIFSLAVVALDLLIKESPLPKDRLIKSCANDEEHIDRVLKQLSIDKDLKNILHKALAQIPDNRYSNMQSFADDLNNWLNSKPVNATSQSFFYRIKKFANRRSALFATMVSFFLFLVIGSIFGYQQFKQIKIEAEKANQVKQFMLDAYAQTNPDYAQGNVITAEDILNYTANKLEKTNLDNAIKFELLQTIGIAFGQIGQAQKAADFLKKSLILEANNTKSLSYRVEFLHNAGNWQELTKTLNNLDINKVKSSLDKARLYRVLAKTQIKESKFEDAAKNLQKTIDLNVANNNKNEEFLSKKLMAEFLFLQSKPKEGIELLEKLLKEPSLDANSSLGMGIRSDLSTMYTDIGDLDKAYFEWEKLIKLQRKILGEQHPELAKSLIQFSGVHRYKGNLKIATELVEEAYEINLTVFGKNNIRTASSLNSLAIIYYHSGDISKAIATMYQAVKIYEEKQSADYSGTLELKSNLAALLLVKERYDEAEKLIREVYSIQLHKLTETHVSTIHSQLILAKTLLKLEQIEESELLAKKGLKNSIKHLGDKSPLTASAYITIAAIYEKQGKYQESLKKYHVILAKNMIQEGHPKFPELMDLIVNIYTKTDNYPLAKKYSLLGIEALKKSFGEDDEKTLKAKNSFINLKKLFHK